MDFCDESSTSEFGFDFVENVFEGKRKNLATTEKKLKSKQYCKR